MTPSGTRTRSMVMPFGRRQLSVTMPTGSAMSRTVLMPSAIASMRACVSVSRSTKAEVDPPERASATSSALAARIADALPRMVRSIASSAAFFCSGEASASTRAAARASRARPVISVVRSVCASMALSEAVIFVPVRRYPLFNPQIQQLRGVRWRGGYQNEFCRKSCGELQAAQTGTTPTTRSSRWIISARPLMPRMIITSGDERPLIFSASSAS